MVRDFVESLREVEMDNIDFLDASQHIKDVVIHLKKLRYCRCAFPPPNQSEGPDVVDGRRMARAAMVISFIWGISTIVSSASIF